MEGENQFLMLLLEQEEVAVVVPDHLQVLVTMVTMVQAEVVEVEEEEKEETHRHQVQMERLQEEEVAEQVLVVEMGQQVEMDK